MRGVLFPGAGHSFHRELPLVNSEEQTGLGGAQLLLEEMLSASHSLGAKWPAEPLVGESAVSSCGDS